MGISYKFNPFTGNLDVVEESELLTLSWRHSVIDKDVTDPTTLSPSVGDRYLIGLDPAAGTAVDVWAGKDGQLVEYKHAGWDFFVAEIGWVVAVEDEQDRFYYFGGSTWGPKLFESTTATTGLEKVGLDIRVNFETTNPTLQTSGPDELGVKYGNGLAKDASGLIALADPTGGANLGAVLDVNANGVAVKIDDVTIKENGSNRLYVDPAGVDHDALLNFVADEHVAHSGVSVIAAGTNSGLSVSTDNLSANIGLTVNINSAEDLVAPTIGDELLLSDIDDGNAVKKADLASIVNLADHDALTNYVAGEHTDAQIKVSANDTTPGYLENKIVSADTKLTISTLNDGGDEDVQLAVNEGNIVHDNLSGFVSNEHIDHSAVSITGGGILSGGGTIDGNQTITLASSDVDHDTTTNFVANEHIDHSSVQIATAVGTSGLSGGGTIESTRNIVISINTTNDKAAPVAADEILLSDSADSNKLKKTDIGSLVSALVDAPGDIVHTSFSLVNNQVAAANVTGLSFANGVTRSAWIHYSIVIDAASDLYEVGTIRAIQRGADWLIDQTDSGDNSLVNFSITNAGQLQYTSASYASFVSGTLNFRALTTNI